MYDKFKIGHYTDDKNKTGCSVILCPPDTTASCYIAGSAPGSRETALLHPERKLRHIHALLLTGGSAFGLNAAAGVVRWLEEKGIGYETPFAKIPIVPAAVVFDLYLGSAAVRPTAENAYTACEKAVPDFSEQGGIGAGTGVTVGKWAGLEHAMKSGLGIAEINHGNLRIRALSVVNAVGDVVGRDGSIAAGARSKEGNFLAQDDPSRRWQPPEVGMAENTVLSVLMTNANLDKLQCFLLAQRAQSGLARAIIPASTSFDGDIIFALSNGRQEAPVDLIAELAAEALRKAVINAVKRKTE